MTNFASRFASAPGDAVLCLAPGYYGEFAGGRRRLAHELVITADKRAGGDQRSVVFGPVVLAGSSGVTFDNVTIGGVTISGAAHHLKLRSVNFTGFTTISDVQNATIVFDHDRFEWGARCGITGHNSLLLLDYSARGPSGVTIENSIFAHSDCDGVHTGTGLNVLNNTFYDLCDVGTNHTDNIQFQGAVGGKVVGNFIHEPLDGCVSQGITSFDGGTYGVTIEDNVIDSARPWGIEWYADANSIIDHNTVPYRAHACAFRLNCGGIEISCKDGADCPTSAGHGTQVYDNIARVVVGGGARLARSDHNYNGPSVHYLGGETLSNGFKRFSDYQLALSSAGRHRADDGTNLGLRFP